MRVDIGRQEEGFTIAEVVFSAAIFFFAFTAIMMLMTTNMAVGNQARQKSAMTNAVATYIEQVRAMPYDSIGTVGGTPNGVLASSTTYSVNGYTIVVVPTVTWYDDPAMANTQNYKKVAMSVTCTGPVSNSKTLTTQVYILISQGGSGNNVVLTPPTVGFTSPASSSPVPVMSGSSQMLAVWATANGAGVNLTTINVDVDGVPVVLTGGMLGQYIANSASFSQTLYWDTLAVSNGTSVTPDGMHTLKIEAWDSNSQQGFITMQVQVSNHAPTPPGSVTVADASAAAASAMKVSWPVCYDDLMVADHYLVTQFVQGSLANGTTSLTGWTQNPSVGRSVSTTSTTFNSLAPFTRYYYGVMALTSSNVGSAVTGGIGITRPMITGLWTVSSPGNGAHTTWTTSETVNVAAPTFPYSSISNTLWRSAYSNMSGATQVGAATSSMSLYDSNVAATTSTQFNAGSWYYQVRSTVVPVGYPSASNAAVTLKSNIIGPSGTNDGTNVTMTNVGW